MGLEEVFPGCRCIMTKQQWQQVAGKDHDVSEFARKVFVRQEELGLTEFLPGLARLEVAIAQLKEKGSLSGKEYPDYLTINPRFELLPLISNPFPTAWPSIIFRIASNAVGRHTVKTLARLKNRTK